MLSELDKPSLNRDEVIKAVAEKHGILLGKDDPILSFLAVHDVILDIYASKMSLPLNNLVVQLEEITSKHQGQSKRIAETIVGQTVEKIQKETIILQNNLRHVMDEEQEKYRRTMQSLMNQTVYAAQSARNACRMMICVVVLSFVLTAYFLFL